MVGDGFAVEEAHAAPAFAFGGFEAGEEVEEGDWCGGGVGWGWGGEGGEDWVSWRLDWGGELGGLSERDLT